MSKQKPIATAKKFQHVIVYTTPTQLRKAADTLAMMYRTARVADKCPTVCVNLINQEGLIVDVHVSNVQMEDETQANAIQPK
jgi:hypothetical protein